ncbi:LysR family transcriptional regulator [Comamonas testosteroni]
MPTRHPSHLQDTALRYFFEVVQCGTVSAASANLHVASSAISRQISGLEAQLGTPLFERHARGMVPTAAGLIVAQLARRISLDAEQAIDAINALDSLRAGTVRIATSDAFANELVPQACAAFQRQHPGVRFEVTMVPTLQVSARVLAGDADIGLRFSMSPVQNIAVVYRQSAPVLAVLRPDHALAREATLTLADLARHPLALPPAETTIRQMIDLACSRQGLQLDAVLTTNHAKTLLNFVLHSGGVTVSSEVGARHMLEAGLLVARPLSDAGMDLRDIEVQTLAGRQLPVAAKAFLELLVAQLAP